MSSKWSLCGEEGKLKKGAWTFEEDIRLQRYIQLYSDRRWSTLAKAAGLQRCGRSCRLRWVNYLCPSVKHGNLTPEEECIIIDLHGHWGSRWSLIAGRIPGRTDNQIKNYWRSHLKKQLQNSAQTQNIGNQNCSSRAHMHAKQQSLEVLIGNQNNHNNGLVMVETPTDELCIEDVIRDTEQVQVQVQMEASFVGSNEVEGSIQNEMGIAGHDVLELSRMLYSFPSGIPIECYAMPIFEASKSADHEIMYPTHQCESDLGSDIMLWNMELDTPFVSNLEDFTSNTTKPPFSYENNHNHGTVNMETAMDKFCIEEVIRYMDQVQVQAQVEASFVGTNEVEGSIQSDMGVAGHDAAELSRMLYSFPLGIPIESYAM